MTRYEMAVENVGMDSRMKLLEMQHWFDGYPAKIVAAYVTERCADTGYSHPFQRNHVSQGAKRLNSGIRVIHSQVTQVNLLGPSTGLDFGQ